MKLLFSIFTLCIFLFSCNQNESGSEKIKLETDSIKAVVETKPVFIASTTDMDSLPYLILKHLYGNIVKRYSTKDKYHGQSTLFYVLKNKNNVDSIVISNIYLLENKVASVYESNEYIFLYTILDSKATEDYDEYLNLCQSCRSIINGISLTAKMSFSNESGVRQHFLLNAKKDTVWENYGFWDIAIKKINMMDKNWGFSFVSEVYDEEKDKPETETIIFDKNFNGLEAVEYTFQEDLLVDFDMYNKALSRSGKMNNAIIKVTRDQNGKSKYGEIWDRNDKPQLLGKGEMKDGNYHGIWEFYEGGRPTDNVLYSEGKPKRVWKSGETPPDDIETDEIIQSYKAMTGENRKNVMNNLCPECKIGVIRNGYCDLCHVASPEAEAQAIQKIKENIEKDPNLHFTCPYCGGSKCAKCNYKGIMYNNMGLE